MRLTLVRFSRKFRDEFAEMTKKTELESKSISDYFVWMFKDRDFTMKGLKNKLDAKRMENIRQANCFFDRDFAKLGAELHSATYVLKLGGRCRLQGSNRWIGLENNQDTSSVLPQERSSTFKVEGLDLSKTVIQEAGISNFEHCTHLKTLMLTDCYFVDDWFISRLVHAFSNRLENLELSGCKAITDNGLSLLGYLNYLKRLNIENVDGVKQKEFISLLLEDHNQNLRIKGSEHLSEETLKKIQDLHPIVEPIKKRNKSI